MHLSPGPQDRKTTLSPFSCWNLTESLRRVPNGVTVGSAGCFGLGLLQEDADGVPFGPKIRRILCSTIETSSSIEAPLLCHQARRNCALRMGLSCWHHV